MNEINQKFGALPSRNRFVRFAEERDPRLWILPERQDLPWCDAVYVGLPPQTKSPAKIANNVIWIDPRVNRIRVSR